MTVLQRPKNSHNKRMMGIGTPSSQSKSPRPIIASMVVMESGTRRTRSGSGAERKSARRSKAEESNHAQIQTRDIRPRRNLRAAPRCLARPSVQGGAETNRHRRGRRHLHDEVRDGEAARQAGIDFEAVGWGYARSGALRRL